MSEGHMGPDDEDLDGQTPAEEAGAAETPAAEQAAGEEPAADEPAAEEPAGQTAAEKPAPKKRAPRRSAPKAAGEKPRRAAQKPAEPLPPPPQEEEEESGGIFAALREPVVMWSVIGGAVVILAALGYVGWTQFGHHRAKGGANALAERSVCEATLDRVQAYGVLSPAAQLAQDDADKTQIKDRVVCHAKTQTMQYAMTVDVPCKDMGDDSCLKLYSVTQSDGTALFQRQM